ncbi:maleylacetoacetate isomerase [Devosia limi DSM 17137]|uniref:Maleylacetoacetate isomerase n=1 Tax=Devosia limi DSM 17137 TaxID=1121477 RepID=A0A0F5LMX5_9HYPH|nr:maleylacetoacetate isomerase [Devosia limi]KKB83706.1 maleylacetoacetate isomerase [Devosia limi DSM 17137]SHE73434.1 maleylacetoacetate isomerase [Devosia limi DSM 17137]
MSDKPALFDYWRSSASYRVRIALHLAGVDYDTVPVDLLAGSHKSEAHRHRNPQGLVSVLDIDGHRFTQSLAIIEYLDETRRLGLLPEDPARRAKARALAQAIAVDIHPVCNLNVVAHVNALVPGDRVKADWMVHFIRPGLEAFEVLLGGFERRPFCTGAQLGLADICLVPQIYNARRWGVVFDDLPRIAAVLRAAEAHPAVLAAFPMQH